MGTTPFPTAEAPTHPCSECGEPAPFRAHTCSDKCRARRSRRIRASKGSAVSHGPAARPAPLSEDEQKSTARDIVVKELTPVVREAITPDVINAIGAMVSLTPKAIALIEADLDNTDPNIRQRAYTLLMKYTLGNPAVAPTPEYNPPAVNIEFAMPRPERTATLPPREEESELVVEADVVTETRLCLACEVEKPVTEFVGNTPRCQECHDALMARKADFLDA